MVFWSKRWLQKVLLKLTDLYYYYYEGEDASHITARGRSLMAAACTCRLASLAIFLELEFVSNKKSVRKIDVQLFVWFRLASCSQFEHPYCIFLFRFWCHSKYFGHPGPASLNELHDVSYGRTPYALLHCRMYDETSKVILVSSLFTLSW